MKIVHTVHSLARSAGGPSRSVLGLAGSLNHGKHQVEVLVSESNEGTEIHAPSILVNNFDGNYGLMAAFQDRMLPGHSGSLVVHDHGIWLPNNRWVAAICRQHGIRRVVSPRGMLEPWALEHKKVKKRLAWSFFQKRDLMTSDCLHATAESEAQQFRNLGLRNPIAIIPNGVEVPNKQKMGSEQQGRVKEDKRTVLFLSRVQKKKGLLNLVEAWKQSRKPGWKVRIVGPEEDNHSMEVKTLVEGLGLSDDFEFVGEISDQEKWDEYRSADLFVLPTFSENFGLVVAEALVSGVPVITTKGAPWAELESHKCGWWVNTGVEPLVSALTEAISLSIEERAEMGCRGRRLVEDNYSWDSIGPKMEEVYEWIVSGGDIPKAVHQN